MKMRTLPIVGVCLMLWVSAPYAQAVPAGMYSSAPGSALVDDVAAARAALEEARAAVLVDESAVAARAERMIELGMWDEAESLLAAQAPGPDVSTAMAELLLERNEYAAAEEFVERALARAPDHRGALLARA
ncbi:MAG TPA: tetratricopeptide repeat protein, partial [Longimicrobiaceae bacterium]|nr:tetratricopeptide repeat protein [Longimicrobiaceae bacterium]